MFHIRYTNYHINNSWLFHYTRLKHLGIQQHFNISEPTYSAINVEYDFVYFKNIWFE